MCTISSDYQLLTALYIYAEYGLSAVFFLVTLCKMHAFYFKLAFQL